MNLFIVLAVVFFVLALFLGFRFYKSPFWNYVDLIYYPLAAIGVGLLFANATVQRQLLELGQREETHKNKLEALTEQRPQVRVPLSQELVDSSFELAATIPDFAKACQYPGNIDARCSVARKLAPSVEDFLKTAHALPGQTLESRLATACPAADKMILTLREGGGMSSLIGDELVSQYKEALEKRPSSLSLDPLKEEIGAFQRHANAKLNGLRSALKDTSQAGEYVMDMHVSEIDFGATLMQGLLPCITAPRQEINLLANWTKTRQTEEDQVSAFEIERKKISSKSAPFPKLAHIQFFIWPYILAFALALKFGKGVATAVEKTRSGRKPPPAPPLDGPPPIAVAPSQQPSGSQPKQSNDQEVAPRNS